MLGPYAAFLVIASVLVVQALFFADGGLLALGCNIFNLGFFPAFIAYPLIYKKLVSGEITRGWVAMCTVLAAVIGLQLGAFSVVLETLASGITELPFSTFVMFMQPIHLAIGLVEGMVTTAVVSFVWQASPQILGMSLRTAPAGRLSIRSALAVLSAAALITGGIVSWYASEKPDGLEWSMAGVSGKEELQGKYAVHNTLADIQQKIAFLPDYSFRNAAAAAAENRQEAQSSRLGTTVSGIVGGTFVLILAFITGIILKRISGRDV
jgi:cobalt/nickel transport system permease protein